MSRDLKPYELHELDKELTDMGYISIKDLHRHIKSATGSFITFETNDDDNAIMHEKYPELSCLFDNLKNLYPAFKTNINALVIFNEIESELVKLKTNFSPNEHIDLNNCKSIYDYTKAWYAGCLDPQFYYNTANNSSFENIIRYHINNFQNLNITIHRDATLKAKLKPQVFEALIDKISDAINSECGYDKDNITNKAWDFFENDAENMILSYIESDFNTDSENIDAEISELTDKDITDYLENAMYEFESNHGYIRQYDY